MEVKASEGQADEAVMSMLMKDLPEYLQNVLLACGYDKVSAIAKIDVSYTLIKCSITSMTILMIIQCKYNLYSFNYIARYI